MSGIATLNADFDRQVRETLDITHAAGCGAGAHADMISLAPTCHGLYEKTCACSVAGCKCVVQTTQGICHMCRLGQHA